MAKSSYYISVASNLQQLTLLILLQTTVDLPYSMGPPKRNTYNEQASENIIATPSSNNFGLGYLPRTSCRPQALAAAHELKTLFSSVLQKLSLLFLLGQFLLVGLYFTPSIPDQYRIKAKAKAPVRGVPSAFATTAQSHSRHVDVLHRSRFIAAIK